MFQLNNAQARFSYLQVLQKSPHWKHPRSIRVTPTRVSVSLTFTFAIDLPAISANATVSTCPNVSDAVYLHRPRSETDYVPGSHWDVRMTPKRPCPVSSTPSESTVHIPHYDITLKITSTIINTVRRIRFSRYRVRSLYTSFCQLEIRQISGCLYSTWHSSRA